MQAGLAQARLRIRESLDAHPELTIILDATGNPSSRLRARFVSQEGETLKVHLATALGLNLLVSIAGEIETGAGREPLLGRYRVASCKIAGIGKYQADLTAEPVAESAGSTTPKADADDEADHYEVLQLSRTADVDTIRRVFHVLAQRYHPDNRETGNQEKFRQRSGCARGLKRSGEARRTRCFPGWRGQDPVQALRYAAEHGRRAGGNAQASGDSAAALRQTAHRGATAGHARARFRGDAGLPSGAPGVRPLDASRAAAHLRAPTATSSRSPGRASQAFEAEQGDFAKKALIALPAPAQSA